jgi:hypothetical protein
LEQRQQRWQRRNEGQHWGVKLRLSPVL